MIKIHINIKFRALGITFGTVDKILPFVIPFPIPVPIPGFGPTTLFNERGVFVQICSGDRSFA